MAARVNDVCDAVVAAIDTWWATANPPKGASDSVVRDYLPDLNEESQGANPRPVGRRVYVFPDDSVHHGATDRAGDDDEHAVVVAVEEWYTTAGRPDRAWIDVRVNFLESLWKLLRNAQAEPAVVAGSRPETAVVTDWYDAPMLRTNRAYLGFVRVSYREIADPTP